MEKIGLEEAIRALRSELSAAAAASVGEDLRFKVGPIKVELEVVTERTTTGRSGLRFWVVDVGADHARTGVRAHRLHVELVPIVGSEPLLTGDDQIPG